MSSQQEQLEAILDELLAGRDINHSRPKYSKGQALSAITALIQEAEVNLLKEVKAYRTYQVGGNSKPILTFNNEVHDMVDCDDIDRFIANITNGEKT